MSKKPSKVAGLRAMREQQHAEIVSSEVILGNRRDNMSEEDWKEAGDTDDLIRDGMAEFVVVGALLKKMRDRHLYTRWYDTFEEYARKRHDLGRAYAYRLMDAADTVRLIEDRRSDVANLATLPEPANEAQTRPLLQLATPERRVEAWEKAVERATEKGGRVTAKVVTEVVREMRGDPKPKRKKAPPAPEPDPEPEPEDAESLALEAFTALHGILDRWPGDDYRPLEASLRQFLDDLQRRAAA